ncbi:DUF1801 domain-containing protein [Tsuneonella sp. SYSU-LHT278]|uniref:DUF1801 domain-containing protein n=1 Tax=Tsuneonella sediminis TaxID=3416089 RepID=UPI003F7B184B
MDTFPFVRRGPYGKLHRAARESTMARYEAKTRVTPVSPAEFIAELPDPRRQEEARLLDALHRRVTGLEPKMWGPSIIGYGSYRYRYASGHEGEAMRAGFSPRKAALTVYLMGTYCDRQPEADALFARLGKHRAGKSCLYISRLSAVDSDALEGLVKLSWDTMNALYPA